MSKMREISRRDFIKSAATGVAGLAAIGMLGCDSAQQETTTGSASTVGSTAAQAENQTSTQMDVIKTNTNYEVIDCGDLIIVGAGNSAVGMARAAIAQGKKVTMIDKGPFGFGGVSGYNWDIYTTFKDTDGHPEYGCVDGTDQTINASFVNAAVMTYQDQARLPLDLLQRGQVLPQRNADGTNNWYATFDFGVMKLQFLDGNMSRVETDVLRESQMVTVYDRTMITEYILDQGRCVGVAGIYLPTGDYRVFRSKAVISSAGGCVWFYGWTGVSPYSNNSKDNTGELDVSALRHGCGLAHGEFPSYDFMTFEPKGLSFGWGTSLDADGNEPWLFHDKDGNQLWEEGPLTMATVDRKVFNQTIAKKMLEDGIADEEECLRINIKGKHLRNYAKTTKTLLSKFDVDAESLLKIHNESYEHICSPIIDATGMTEIPGVFQLRGAGSVDPNGTVSSGTNVIYAPYVATCACKYIDTLSKVDSIDLSDAEKEFERLEEIRTRQVEDSLAPHEICHAIQNVCGKVWGLVRREADMQAALEELERIRKEDLPRMCIRNASRTYNTDWKEAIEVYNILYIAILSVKASLERKETRGQYVYVDYPEQDDDNFNCALVGYLQEDGTVEFTKRQFNA